MNTKANIIIIEDEKNICNFIETVLSPQGYQVTSANTGTDGLKLIESLKPDVVLLDLGLPDMDGLELIQEVRSTSALPIIVISARPWSAARWLPWTWEQTTTSPNPLAQLNCWPASAPRCATARGRPEHRALNMKSGIFSLTLNDAW